jgi:hypothetical protein
MVKELLFGIWCRLVVLSVVVDWKWVFGVGFGLGTWLSSKLFDTFGCTWEEESYVKAEV